MAQVWCGSLFENGFREIANFSLVYSLGRSVGWLVDFPTNHTTKWSIKIKGKNNNNILFSTYLFDWRLIIAVAVFLTQNKNKAVIHYRRLQQRLVIYDDSMRFFINYSIRHFCRKIKNIFQVRLSNGRKSQHIHIYKKNSMRESCSQYNMKMDCHSWHTLMFSCRKYKAYVSYRYLALS